MLLIHATSPRLVGLLAAGLTLVGCGRAPAGGVAAVEHQSDQVRGLDAVAPAARSLLEIGVGGRTLKLRPCTVRFESYGEGWQLVAGTGDGSNQGPRLYLESAGSPVPKLAVLTLKTPLHAGEDRVYREHDLRLTFTKPPRGQMRVTGAGELVTGLVSGRVEDLLLGRTHELRARFHCLMAP